MSTVLCGGVGRCVLDEKDDEDDGIDVEDGNILFSTTIIRNVILN
jgi:hypothetical protein